MSRMVALQRGDYCVVMRCSSISSIKVQGGSRRRHVSPTPSAPGEHRRPVRRRGGSADRAWRSRRGLGRLISCIDEHDQSPVSAPWATEDSVMGKLRVLWQVVRAVGFVLAAVASLSVEESIAGGVGVEETVAPALVSSAGAKGQVGADRLIDTRLDYPASWRVAQA